MKRIIPPSEPFSAEGIRSAEVWERCFVFGTYDIATVLKAVKNSEWQQVRISMLGATLYRKWDTLREFLIEREFDLNSQVCVTNYINALKRGGLIK